MIRTLSKLSLTSKILVGMVLGLLTGALIKLILQGQDDVLIPLGFTDLSVKGFFIEGVFHAGGQIFVASLKMLVVPLVFISLVCGVCNLSDPSMLGRLGGKSIALYLATTAIAISIAISVALVVSPGEGVNMPTDTSYEAKEAPSFAQVLIDMVPTNPINAMAEGNMLQIIVFAILFGIAVTFSGEPGKRLAAIFNDLNDVVLKLVLILMNFAPFGVYFLMAKLFSQIDYSLIANLVKYFFVVLGALFIHALLTYPTILKLLSGLNPLIFLKKMKANALFAFSTASSGATIPVTMETATKKMGADNSVASFTVPLGATINMDGTAIMQGVATVFIAQVYGYPLELTDYLTVILTATLASIGTAAVPGVGLVMLALVLDQVGLPVEAIGLILGVDRLLDMTRTAVNVTGDCMVTCIMAKSERRLDQDVFNDPNAGLKEEQLEGSK